MASRVDRARKDARKFCDKTFKGDARRGCRAGAEGFFGLVKDVASKKPTLGRAKPRKVKCPGPKCWMPRKRKGGRR